MDYIINLFGTGIRYWICEIPLPVFEEMNTIRLNHKVEWEELLFDFDFLQHFGYKHWSELSDQPEQTGFLLDPQNRIEIKQGARFITRFKAIELLNDQTLFPLYQTSHSPLTFQHKQEHKTLVLIQFEKGLIAKYKVDATLFSIHEFSFKTASLQDLTFLTEIHSKQSALIRIADDSLAIGCSVLPI